MTIILIVSIAEIVFGLGILIELLRGRISTPLSGLAFGLVLVLAGGYGVALSLGFVADF